MSKAIDEWVGAGTSVDEVIDSYLTLGEVFVAMGKALADIHVRAWSSVPERLDVRSDG